MSTSRLLFVTWDGPQVTYLESLYMPVFARLVARGHAIHVLQFTWSDRTRRALTSRVCEAGGATYRAVPVLRRPVSAGALVTALLGARHVAREVARHGIDVVMPRSTLPALATMRALRRRPGPRMIFDADGLPHDERVDFEGWSADGAAYRMLRDIEASAVRRADVVLTRSRRAVDILGSRAGPSVRDGRFMVVGNGRDPARFAPAEPEARRAMRRELGVAADAPLLVYAGSLGAQYCLPQMLDFLRCVRARRADAQLLILTGSPEDAWRLLDSHGGLQHAVMVRRVGADDVPRHLGAADLGLALRQASFSMQAVAPIKLGEYLLCGLPVLSTSGIGDSDALVPDAVGRVLVGADADALDRAADWFVHDVLPHAGGFRQRSREQGQRHFGIDATVDVFDAAIAKALHAPGDL